MIIKNKNIDTLHYSELYKESHSLYLSKSIIKTIDFNNFDPLFEIVIENCIIENFFILSCWFKKGLIFRGNNVLNYIDYQMGGQNEFPIIITENIFNNFVNFFDCHFENDLEVQNNIFLKGTNLFGNLNAGSKNTFNGSVKSDFNIGNLTIDGNG